MTAHANVRTSVSALMGAAIADAGGAVLGHVKEFAVAPSPSWPALPSPHA